MNKVIAALKDKPSTSEAAHDVEINSDDATNVDENDDAALSRQGNRELEDLVTSAGIDDLADTYRSMELNEIIREARALISDEDGNVRKLNNPEEVEAFINDILDEEGEGDTDSLSPSSDLGGEDVNGRVSSGMEAPREEEILQLSTMKNVRVSQSSVFLNREAKLAIDGNTDGDWPSISHTYNQKEAWWQVSLPSAYPVSSIRIWNRRDGGGRVAAAIPIFSTTIRRKFI